MVCDSADTVAGDVGHSFSWLSGWLAVKHPSLLSGGAIYGFLVLQAGDVHVHVH